MATRNINSFIEHLMNEAMTTSGGGGGDNRTPGDPASYDNPNDAPSGIPFAKPKPTSFDQSDEDGNIIPGRGPRRPAITPFPFRLPPGYIPSKPAPQIPLPKPGWRLPPGLLPPRDVFDIRDLIPPNFRPLFPGAGRG